MKGEMEKNKKMLKMQETDEMAIKLMKIDKVCQMASGENYTTHYVV
jgi:hypothetical protein